MSWLDGARARLRLVFAPRAAEARMHEEIGFHIEMETARLVDQGLDPAEARRRARAAFGGIEHHKESLRDGRGTAWLSGLWLDVTLGLRLLIKYPGLTAVGVVGLAVAVAIGAVSFSAIATIVDGTLPLDDADRIVAVSSQDVRSREENRTHLADVPVWRDTWTAVAELGAYRTIDRNLITRDGRSESVRIAEMSASGFRIARVPPLMGRYIDADDERIGAPPVVVIGYDIWQNRFAGRPDVVGQTLWLGATAHTVIGVMPQGFAFPVNNRIWTPLHLRFMDFVPGEAPALEVFGRLAPGASIDDAQRQLSAIAQRLAVSDSASHHFVRSRVLPYTRVFIDNPEQAWIFHGFQVLISMLLVVIGTNVAALVYARTAARAGEIAIRTALGASRARVIAQLFAEALMLSVAAAVVGLGIAQFALSRIDTLLVRMSGEQLPFWMHLGITPGVLLYVAGLAVLGAVIVGVVPGLGATRQQVNVHLQRMGQTGGMRLGRLWTLLIVAQVAVSAVALPVASEGVRAFIHKGLARPAPVASQFMAGVLHLDEGDRSSREPARPRTVAGHIAHMGGSRGDSESSDATTAAQFANLRGELVRRLRSEPDVGAVVFSSDIPGNEHTDRIEIERETGPAPPPERAGQRLYEARANRVGTDFFDALDVALLSGRNFEPGDYASKPTAVIVNRSFAQRVFGGANPLGRRLRAYSRASDTSASKAAWEEIVGVVSDFPYPTDTANLEPRLYRPLVFGNSRAVTLSVQVRNTAPAGFSRRLRDVTIAVSPMLRLNRIETLIQTFRDAMAPMRLAVLALVLVTTSVIGLSVAGIYALMAFTVTRRRREIGIRAALGAGQRRVVMSILATAARQIGGGILLGTAIVALMTALSNEGRISLHGFTLMAAYAAALGTVGLLGAIGPVRRILRIQPTEALKAE